MCLIYIYTLSLQVNHSKISFFCGEGGSCMSNAHHTPNMALNKLCFLRNLFEVSKHIKMHTFGWCKSAAWSIWGETIRKFSSGSQTLTSESICEEITDCYANIKGYRKIKKNPTLKLVPFAASFISIMNAPFQSYNRCILQQSSGMWCHLVLHRCTDWPFR